ncbi:hypothetical protein ACFYZ9_33885 [Streptomyces sp. NPDC001691]|uniref:hypothetical protein n=1 Tax=Streptomyces sp. NPDC001691 TaxID=3364600 RepID=UPI0036A1C790
MTTSAITQSTTPYRCEVAWHAHTDDRRGPTCRPDTARHPELDDTTPDTPAHGHRLPSGG